MKFSKRFRITAGIIVAIGLGVFFYLRIASSSVDSGRKQLPPLVEVQKPVRHDLSRKLIVNGDVSPAQQANIFSRVSGNIEKMYVDIGTSVKAGQLLARIDATAYREQLRQSAAALAQAEAPLHNVESTFERMKELFGKNLVSQQEFDASQATLRALHAQIDAATSNYANAKLIVSYCTIIAPFSGFITKRFLDAGAYVATSPQNTSTLYTLMNLDNVKIYVNILERDIPMISTITEATVTVDAYRDMILHGRIVKSNQALDLGTRTLTVEVDVDNHDHRLKPGMFATVTFVAETHHDALVLPAAAVLNDDKGKFVYVARDGKAHRVSVQTGLQEQNEVEITQGISADQDIIVLGQQMVKDDVQVRLAQ